jgi:hypothetical protein
MVAEQHAAQLKIALAADPLAWEQGAHGSFWRGIQ